MTAADPAPAGPWDAGRTGRRRLLVPALGVLVLVLLVGVGLAAALFDGENEPSGPGGVSTGPTGWAGPSSPGPADGVGPSDGATTGWPGSTGGPTPDPSTGSGPADAEAAALAELHRIRAADLAGVSMRGQHVAQLASKSVGIVDSRQVAENGTHVFHAVDILAEHRQIRQRHTGDEQIVLILSTDYGKRQLHQGKPLWITLALGDFATADEVTRWCGRQFPNQTGEALDNLCVARKLEPPRD